MKKGPILLALLVLLAAAAAAWMLVSAGGPGRSPVEEVAVDSCSEDVACSAGIAEPTPEVASSATSDVEAPPPAEAPAAEAAPIAPAVSAADAVRLREEADRLIAEGRVPEGIEALRKATAADPSARNHGDLGSLLQRLTAFDEAARHLQQAAELDPTNADRWIALANAWYQAVNPGEAWKAERRAREAEPGLQLGRDASGLRIRKGDSAGAKP